MKVLGIETSCDETSAAVVENGTKIYSNVVASQVRFHKQYGGVVPEIAARKHIEYIIPVVDEALHIADISKNDIDLIAVTVGPGLIAALLVGLTFAKGFAVAKDIPAVGVNHIEGHVHSVFLADKNLSTPLVALVVSGSHTDIFLVERLTRMLLLGRTIDDAAGEAFDKVGRMLGCDYPGGPEIEHLSSAGNIAATWGCDLDRLLDQALDLGSSASAQCVHADPPA